MKRDPEYLETIPCFPPEGYTMRAEIIRHWLRAIGAIAAIVFVGFALLWGTP
jgi:hypothetical protein